MPLIWDGVVAQNKAWGSVAYSPTLGRWLALSGASSFSSNAVAMISDDDAASWSFVNGGSAVWIDNMDGDGHPGAGCQYHGLQWDPLTSQFLGVGISEEVGDNEYLMLYTSPDGVTWNRQLIAHFNSGGLFGNGILVVNGPTYIVAHWTTNEGTLIFTSTDLTTWTKVTVPADMLPGAAIYANGQYVVVGITQNKFGVPTSGIPIITAIDPTKVDPQPNGWTGRMGFDVGFVNTRWVGLAFGASGYVAVARAINGAGAAMNSGDGATWALQTMPTLSGLFGSLSGWTDLTYVAGIGYIAINGNSPSVAAEGSAVSVDGGVTWSFVATPTQNAQFDALALGGGKIVAASQAAATYHILTALEPVWYYNPDTNHYAFGLNPGPPWIAQTPTLSIDCAGISPDTGLTVGGSLVTIPGTGFGDGATVTFGGVAATSVTVVDANTITVIIPAHAAGAVDVTVTNPDGTTFTCPNGFTYTAPVPIPFSGANLSLTQQQGGAGGGGGWVTKECTGHTGSPRIGT